MLSNPWKHCFELVFSKEGIPYCWKFYAIIIGVSMGAQGTACRPPPPPPPGTKFIFMQFFGGNFAKSHVGAPPWRVGTPTSGNLGSATGNSSFFMPFGFFQKKRKLQKHWRSDTNYRHNIDEHWLFTEQRYGYHCDWECHAITLLDLK